MLIENARDNDANNYRHSCLGYVYSRQEALIMLHVERWLGAAISPARFFAYADDNASFLIDSLFTCD